MLTMGTLSIATKRKTHFQFSGSCFQIIIFFSVNDNYDSNFSCPFFSTPNHGISLYGMCGGLSMCFCSIRYNLNLIYFKNRFPLP